MAVPWWIPQVLNSVVSFVLLVFTIPLAFDVGGRDCGLVRPPPPSNIPSPPRATLIAAFVDVLPRSRHILFLPLHAPANASTLTIPLAPQHHRHFSKCPYPDDFDFRIE